MHILIYLLLHQTQSKYAFGLEKFWFLSTLTMISLSLSTSFFSSDNLCVCVCFISAKIPSKQNLELNLLLKVSGLYIHFLCITLIFIFLWNHKVQIALSSSWCSFMAKCVSLLTTFFKKLHYMSSASNGFL